MSHFAGELIGSLVQCLGTHEVNRSSPAAGWDSTMTVSLRRRVLDRVVFSETGLRVFPKVAPLLKRGYNIIVNNDLSPEVNGENWLITRFPVDGVYLDGGYHSGEWSSKVLSLKRDSSVFAFDPWPEAASRHASSPDAARIEFFPIALSDEPGTMTFYDFNNACNSLTRRKLEVDENPKEYEVDVTSLDVWCTENDVKHIDLLKLDLEGYDLYALEGARRLLETQSISSFVFEYGSGWIGSNRYLGEAASYVQDVGYKLFKLFNGFVVPVNYDVRYETFAGAMFVGVSPQTLAEGLIPIRHLEL